MKKKNLWKRFKKFWKEDIEIVMIKMIFVFGSMFVIMACVFCMVFLLQLFGLLFI